jgi:membrane-associated phospholipid phosphatase
MKLLIKTNISFLLPFILFQIIGTYLVEQFNKTELHLIFNKYHNSFFDTFFQYFTYLGDGIFAGLIVIVLLTINYRYALFVALSNIISGGFTQILKRTIFSDEPRPTLYFQNIQELYLIQGFDNHMFYSFPSGHATGSFALFFSLAIITKHKSIKFVCFVFAIFSAYSRVYLSQHFFYDILIGSLIGTIITIIFYFIIYKNKSEKLNNSIKELFN